MGGRFKREGIYVYLWLIHVDVWQKPTKFCKLIILQLKNNKTNKQTNKINQKNLPVKKKKYKNPPQLELHDSESHYFNI